MNGVRHESLFLSAWLLRRVSGSVRVLALVPFFSGPGSLHELVLWWRQHGQSLARKESQSFLPGRFCACPAVRSAFEWRLGRRHFGQGGGSEPVAKRRASFLDGTVDVDWVSVVLPLALPP